MEKDVDKIIANIYQTKNLAPSLDKIFGVIKATIPKEYFKEIIETTLNNSLMDSNDKITPEQILGKCYLLLKKFYEYYNVDKESIISENEILNSAYMKLNLIAKEEYSNINKVIFNVRYNINTISEDNFLLLNSYYRKYTKKG